MSTAGPPQGANSAPSGGSAAAKPQAWGGHATAEAYIGLGSNLAHPRRQVARALRAMARLPRTRVVAVSRNYRSAPIGASGPQPDYVNAVAAVRTALAPRALLRRLLSIERRQGRQRARETPRNAARTLDLDLLLYERRRMRGAALTLPHPRMHERAFVLRPLLDVAPHARIPGRGLARLRLHAVRGQRVVATRRHCLR
ncbi:MAG TPA: 2-amino-4-hydroxy-6-hydroxymethyldihydropteridine diphosphokinase [Casimicrobiaceae bacterium]